MTKALHPALLARAAAVKAAHAHLAATQPGFRALPSREQFKATQAYLKQSSAK